VNDVVAKFVELNPVIVAQKSGESPARLVLRMAGIVRALQERLNEGVSYTDPFLPELKENIECLKKIVRTAQRCDRK
jgi:hypothetical protein